MNKQDLIKKLAEKLDVSQKEAKEMYEAVVDVAVEAITDSENDKFTLPGLVTFTKTARDAATRRNPKTGEPVEVPAHTHLKASVNPSLKDSVR